MFNVAQQISKLIPYLYGVVATFINNTLVNVYVAVLINTQSPDARPGFCVSNRVQFFTSKSYQQWQRKKRR